MNYQNVNPFLLHNPKDENQRSWIYCESKKPETLRKLFTENFSRCDFKDVSRWSILRWKKGKTGIPLWAIERCYNNSQSKNKDELIKNIDYVYSPGGHRFLIPKIIDEDIGLILGIHAADGSIPKNRGGWIVTDRDEASLKYLQNIIKQKLKAHSRIIQRKENKFTLVLESKAFCRFLVGVCEMPRGKKSHIIRETNIIKKSPLNVRKMFVNGVIGSDGTARVDKKNQMRVVLEIRSKELRDDVSNILHFVSIKHSLNEREIETNWGKGKLYSVAISGNNQVTKFVNDIGLWHIQKFKRIEPIYQKKVGRAATPLWISLESI